MKFSFNTLKKFLKTEASIDTVINALNTHSVEVENVHNIANELKDFIVVSIVSLKKHPNADKLTLCKINDGSSEIRQIVCGADNLENDMHTVLANPGTIIPNSNLKIKISKIRGEQSNGMLCSAQELNLKNLFNNNGIIKLSNNTIPGTRLIDICDLNDQIIEVNITPNRGDCASVFGIARDLVAIGIGTLIQPKIKQIPISLNKNIKIDKKLAPLICCAKLDNINNKKTPYWMKKELVLSGIKSINMPIDTTNYIRLIFGQPMHVYNYSSVNGLLNIGILEKSLKFTALNEQDIQLNSGAMVIQNDKKETLALAGIIGSKNSQYTSESSIILEAAWFNPQEITVNGEKYNIHTDAQYNFERSVDIEFTKNALLYAIDLIITECGGTLNKAEFNQTTYQQPKPINYNQINMAKFLGHTIPNNTIKQIAEKLGYKINNDCFITPSWRSNDITTEHNFFGEIARIYGYDNIKSKPSIAYSNSRITNDANIFNNANIIRKILANRGMHETITWSFNTNNENLQFKNFHSIALKNPINIEMSVMRTTLLPSLLKAIKFNQNNDEHSASLFEINNIYIEEDNIKEKLTLTAVRKGTAIEKNIYCKKRKFDASDIKADFLSIVNNFSNDSITICRTKEKGFISSFLIKINEIEIGIIGKINTKITKKYEINDPIYALIIDIQSLSLINKINNNNKNNNNKNNNNNISKFQSIKRDFSFIVNENIKPHIIKQSIHEAIKNNKLITAKIKLFDIYQDIGHRKNNETSMSFKIIMKPKIKTLTDIEINKISNLIIKNIKSKHNATIRDGK